MGGFVGDGVLFIRIYHLDDILWFGYWRFRCVCKYLGVSVSLNRVREHRRSGAGQLTDTYILTLVPPALSISAKL